MYMCCSICRSILQICMFLHEAMSICNFSYNIISTVIYQQYECLKISSFCSKLFLWLAFDCLIEKQQILDAKALVSSGLESQCCLIASHCQTRKDHIMSTALVNKHDFYLIFVILFQHFTIPVFQHGCPDDKERVACVINIIRRTEEMKKQTYINQVFPSTFSSCKNT